MKKRLDHLLQELLPNLTRNQITSFIMQGKVKVDDRVVTKPGHQVKPDSKLDYDISEPKFVSRAGFKLEKALDEFNINVEGLVAMDAGISTGGFSDCMLQRGIQKIYGIDVGYGQVHERVASNPKVVVLEKTNLRNLEGLPVSPDIATLDLSFISVLKVMDAVAKLLKDKAQLIVLIKPQFEAEKHQIGTGGIVKDEKVHKEVVDKVVSGIQKFGFQFKGVIESPIKGTTGNKEFLAYFTRP